MVHFSVIEGDMARLRCNRGDEAVLVILEDLLKKMPMPVAVGKNEVVATQLEGGGGRERAEGGGGTLITFARPPPSLSIYLYIYILHLSFSTDKFPNDFNGVPVNGRGT